ncbi:hypothetical protein GS416_12235 [Rhodococcus hoagii]|nr:hypothetical protein [Prescottella equi]
MSVLVISGTSTDVGKTVVTAALAAALRAAGQSLRWQARTDRRHGRRTRRSGGGDQAQRS